MEHLSKNPEESGRTNDLEHMSVDDIFYYELLIDGGPDDTLAERQRLDRFVTDFFDLPSRNLEHGIAVFRAFAAHEDERFRSTAAICVDGLFLADPAVGFEVWKQLLEDPSFSIRHNAYMTVGMAAEQGRITEEDEARLEDIYKEFELRQKLREAGLLVEGDEGDAEPGAGPTP